MVRMNKTLKIGKSYQATFSPDGSCAAVIGRCVSVWDLAKRTKIFRALPLSHPSYASFSPCGTKLAVKNTSGRIVILDARSGEVVRDYKNLFDGEGSNIVFSRDGECLVDGSWRGRLTIRRTDSDKTECVHEEPDGMIQAVHANDQGDKWLVRYSIKQTTENSRPSHHVAIYNWPLQNRSSQPLLTDAPHIVSSALSPCGHHLAVAHAGVPSKVAVYGIADTSCVAEVMIPSFGAGLSLAWSRDGSMIGLAQSDRFVFHAWPGLKVVAEVIWRFPCSVDFSPDGMFVALGSWETGMVVPRGQLTTMRGARRFSAD